MDPKLKNYLIKYLQLCKLMNEDGQRTRKGNIFQRKALKIELEEINWTLKELVEL